MSRSAPVVAATPSVRIRAVSPSNASGNLQKEKTRACVNEDTLCAGLLGRDARLKVGVELFDRVGVPPPLRVNANRQERLQPP